MDTDYEDRNKSQIIRKDAKNCFVESRNDTFEIGKAHLEFATYDTSRPAGQRQTNHVNIYIDMGEFLCLANEALSGMLHARARQQKAIKDTTPLYQSLGGTSAARLQQAGRPRPDGKSLSRIVKLIYSDRKDDHYLLIADSGPGEADAKGLIVPKFAGKPENHVSVILNWRAINEIMVMTKTHYEAWLSAKYSAEYSQMQKTQNPRYTQNVKPQTSHQNQVPQAPATQSEPVSPEAQGYGGHTGIGADTPSQYIGIRMY